MLIVEEIMKNIVAILCVLLHVSSNSALSEKPNVLFIVIDDLRASLGCYGGPIISPNIDQLASKSALFTNTMVQQAVCGPSRTSFLTGRRPDTTRLYDFGSYWRTHAGNYTTLPQHFKENGYFTASVGKVFHPGIASGGNDDYPYSWSVPAYHPPTQQYQANKLCPNLDGTLHNNVICPVKVSDMPQKSLPDIQSLEVSSSILKNLSVALHPTHKQGKPTETGQSSPDMQPPFFLAVGFHKPHIPWKYPEEFKSLYPIESVSIATNPYRPPTQPDVAYEDYYNMRTYREDVAAMNTSFPFGTIPLQFHAPMRQSYYAAASYMDSMVGKLLQTLNETGFSNNTIVVLFGDHGWQLGEHAEWCKYSNYELATRVPLIVHIPGVTDKPRSSPIKNELQNSLKMNQSQGNVKSSADSGMVVTELVELVDLFPTLSELAGITVPPVCPPEPFNVTLCSEGYSFAPLLEPVQGSNTILQKDGMEKLTSKRYSRWKNATFSQYPRPGVTPNYETDLPSLVDITIMGYSMRTKDHHYTEWIGFNPKTFQGNWTDVKATELYMNGLDYDQNQNVAADPQFKDIVKQLSYQLQMGWRESLPVPA
ncbi:iduronate 2-sulfatase [Strongylocentrotus purpuratus]|uniref:Iduronate 2-sulfatase n=1 Tax=Strongylocentrotus purpuratus TaxID=7668 RepID=A0A7M7NMT9_STRPU|nr:iduronate 2-sulfatase [Strongylocentrotus purpuratus]